MLGKKLIEAATGANAAGESIEDLFSTWLYTGNSSTQTITNGIDLAGEGGMVWVKARSAAYGNALWDTVRGPTKRLSSDTNAAEATRSQGLTAFNFDGFTYGSEESVNASAHSYASWTFRKAPGFFDVVTYTGTGSARTIAHNLGSVPGCIIVKRLDTLGAWITYHRSLTATSFLQLESTTSLSTSSSIWNNTDPDSSNFTVGTNGNVNASGGTYVAYLFAHDEQIFGEGGDQSVIKCGSFTEPASGSTTVSLGWEPQYVLAKPFNAAGGWYIFDNMRTLNYSNSFYLRAESSATETQITPEYMSPTSTGFTFKAGFIGGNTDYIYIAIRRGPMKPPTSGTEVFKVFNTSVSFNPQEFPTNFAADAVLAKASNQSSAVYFSDNLRGGKFLETNTTNAESGAQFFQFSSNTSVLSSIFNAGGGIVQWLNAFRRAPGFFDVVAYTGDGTLSRTIPHNLGVAPEMVIVKARSTAGSWWVFNSNLSPGKVMYLNGANAEFAYEAFGTHTPTHIQLEPVPNNATNASGTTYIAYLFASVPGVSKLGNYVGTGTALDINCGFASGARFVLIKCADVLNSWHIWDTARGIVVGNEPYLKINSTDAEITSDFIEPLSSGFRITSTAPAAINALGSKYIYLAIA